MVGTNSWRAGEVVWILKEWQTSRNLDELVKKFRAQFPTVEHHSLHKGISYVWTIYSKDPSYNHKFTVDEIGVIMEQHFVHRLNLDRTSGVFEEVFPQHDWKKFVDKRTAIGCVIAKFAWDGSTRCIPWGYDEIRFIIRNRMKLKSWERLFEVFQAWKKRKDLTLEKLQYLCVTHGYKYLDTKQGLHNHYQTNLASPEEEDSTTREIICGVPNSKITRQNPAELPIVQANLSAKRKRDARDIIDEDQVKRVCHVSPQPRSNKQDHDSATEVHELSPSTYRDLRANVVSLAVQRESHGSLNEQSDKPQSHLTRARMQNARKIKAVLPNDRGRAPIPKSKRSATQLHHREASNSQHLNARQHLSGATPQYDPNCGTGGQGDLITPHIGELAIGRTHPDQLFASSSYLSHLLQTGLNELPPRSASPFANISENQNLHIGYVPQDIEQDTPLHWQEQQLVSTDRYLARSTERSWNQFDGKIKHEPIRNDFTPTGHLNFSMGAQRGMALPNGNLQSAIAGYVPGGILATPASVVSDGVPIGYDMGNASTLHLGQCGLNCQNIFDTRATSWMPNSINSRTPYANQGMNYNSTLPPRPNMPLMQVPFSQRQAFIDPALINDRSIDSPQHRFEGNYLQYGIYAPIEDTNIQPGNFLQQPYNIDAFMATNIGDNQHSGFSLTSIPTNAMATPQAAADDFQFSGPDRFPGSLNIPTSEHVQGLEALPMAHQSTSTLGCKCEACQPNKYNSSGQSRYPTLEVSRDLGTNRNPDFSGYIALKEQQHSHLDQQGSSSDWPIIIGSGESDNPVPTVEEWDIYSATPLHALFPSVEEEAPVFESGLAVLPSLDDQTGERDAPDILQEVAALGDFLVSEEDRIRYSTVSDFEEVEDVSL